MKWSLSHIQYEKDTGEIGTYNINPKGNSWYLSACYLAAQKEGHLIIYKQTEFL